MSDQERIEVIRSVVVDCIQYSRTGCTWGHEADIKFLLEKYDELKTQNAKLIEARDLSAIASATLSDESCAKNEHIDELVKALRALYVGDYRNVSEWTVRQQAADVLAKYGGEK